MRSWIVSLARSAALCAAPSVALASPMTKELAIERATVAANRALDQAYAKKKRRPGEMRPPHHGPWVDASSAAAEQLSGGWRVRWMLPRPAGFECEAVVRVPDKGAPVVEKAAATFSPD